METFTTEIEQNIGKSECLNEEDGTENFIEVHMHYRYPEFAYERANRQRQTGKAVEQAPESPTGNQERIEASHSSEEEQEDKDPKWILGR